MTTTNLTADEEAAQVPELPRAAYRCMALVREAPGATPYTCRVRVVVEARNGVLERVIVTHDEDGHPLPRVTVAAAE